MRKGAVLAEESKSSDQKDQEKERWRELRIMNYEL